MDGAEVYMLMIRKTGLPILGEAVALPFTQQVEVLDWNWKIVNQLELERRKKDEAHYEVESKDDREAVLDLEVAADDLRNEKVDKRIRDLLTSTDRNDPKAVRNALKELEANQKKGAGDGAASINMSIAQKNKEAYEKEKKLGNLEFSFSKRVDFASTQMLNCMKLGETLPRVVITIFHRSVSAPLMIVITAKNLRFLKYGLNVEVDETMADMKEDWEAEFSEISFSYTNTRGVDQQKGRLTTDAMAGAKLALAAKTTTSLFRDVVKP